MGEIVKKSGLYADNLDDLTKDTKNLSKLLDELNRLESLRIRDGKNGRKFWNELTNNLKLSGKEAADFAQRLPKLTKELNEHVEVTGRSISASDKLNKRFEELNVSVKTQVAYLVSFGFALNQIKKGLGNMYEEAHRLTNKGLLGAYLKVNEFARRLNLTTQDFEEIINKNRDLITAFGGGVKGVEQLGKSIEDIRGELGYLGRDASKAAGMIVGTLKNFGLRKGDRHYQEQVGKMTKQMKMFNLVFGDTPEQYNELLNQMASEEGYRQRLNGASKNQITAIQNEIMGRVQNFKALGMSTDKIVEYTKSLNDMLNPEKDTFVQRQKESVMMSNALHFMRQNLQSLGTPDALAQANMLEKNSAVYQQYIRAYAKGNKAELKLAEDQMRNSGAAVHLGKARGTLEELNQGPGLKPFQNATEGNVLFNLMKSLGTSAAQTSRQLGPEGPAWMTDEKLSKAAEQLAKEMEKEAFLIKWASEIWEKFRSLMSASLLPLAIGFGSLIGATILLVRSFGSLAAMIEVVKAQLAGLGRGGGVPGDTPGKGGKPKPGKTGKLARVGGAVGRLGAAGLGGYAGYELGSAFNEQYGISDKIAGGLSSLRESWGGDNKKIEAMKSGSPGSGTARPASVVGAPTAGTQTKGMKGNAAVNDAISQAASKHGVDEAWMRKVAMIESKGDPTAKNPRSSAKGLYQFIDSTGSAYGLTSRNVFDPYANADAAARLYNDNKKALIAAGIDPTPSLMYMAHQQGTGGVKALISSMKSGQDPSQVRVGRHSLRHTMDLNGGRGQNQSQFITSWDKKYNLAAPYGGFPDNTATAVAGGEGSPTWGHDKALEALKQIARNTELRNDPRHSAYQVQTSGETPLTVGANG